MNSVRISAIFGLVVGVSLGFPFRYSFRKDLSFINRFIPLKNLFVAGMATIHESYLRPYIDLKGLDPSRAKIVDSFVVLKGPLYIVTDIKQTSVAKALLTAGAILSGVALCNHLINAKKAEKQTAEISPISIVAGAALGAVAWFQLSKVIPTTTGIFFYNWPKIF